MFLKKHYSGTSLKYNLFITMKLASFLFVGSLGELESLFLHESETNAGHFSPTR